MSEFDLSKFIDKVAKADSLGQDEIDSRQQGLRVFRLLVDNTHATDELLNSITLEELEWVFDLISYWPSTDDFDFENGDKNHWGIQHYQVRDIVFSLSRKKSIKRKVTFI
ncbi:hypothetical protein C2I27_03685 [Priestia megaterium]|uniref:hypothetical protein n=1 Tax=Priestia megaterium TaxID=1404 RepID=UPI000D51F959|nr:hypothetical protein [Priestia megaterium]PVC75001.1 hypothetical protein C2I27_03685 [Priestia megaterium]